MICVEEYVIVRNSEKNNIYANGLYLPKDVTDIGDYKKKIVREKNLVYGMFDEVDEGGYAAYLSASILDKLKDRTTIKRILLKTNIEVLKKKISIGTTASIVKIKNNKVITNQIGNSPIYILSQNKFVKLQEKNKNYIGDKKDIKVIQHAYKLKSNDKILLCSKDVIKQIGDVELEYLLSESDDIELIAYKILDYLSKDENISIIILKIKKDYSYVISIIILVLFIIIFGFIFLKAQ